MFVFVFPSMWVGDDWWLVVVWCITVYIRSEFKWEKLTRFWWYLLSVDRLSSRLLKSGHRLKAVSDAEFYFLQFFWDYWSWWPPTFEQGAPSSRTVRSRVTAMNLLRKMEKNMFEVLWNLINNFQITFDLCPYILQSLHLFFNVSSSLQLRSLGSPCLRTPWAELVV